FFFFSSRRRHTRSKRDWSSDVCSSDLPGLGSVTHRSSPAVGPARSLETAPVDEVDDHPQANRSGRADAPSAPPLPIWSSLLRRIADSAAVSTTMSALVTTKPHGGPRPRDRNDQAGGEGRRGSALELLAQLHPALLELLFLRGHGLALAVQVSQLLGVQRLPRGGGHGAVQLRLALVELEHLALDLVHLLLQRTLL